MNGQARFKEVSPTRIVQEVLMYAIERSASDIHFDPRADAMHVRFRVDGLLYPLAKIRYSIMPQIINHIKVLAQLNIAQRKVPQDGKFRFLAQQRDIDVRVSTFPTLIGEKAVLRILDRHAQPIALEKLGFGQKMYQDFCALLKKSSGFFLVSGPTGSGKTTTLYSALAALHDPSKHIITLEDPIEYQIPGITQGHIYPPAGFTFETGMRALLRQDPDIVMIGEIRDAQTAGIAIEAALTGHLVFSTIHTNDAPSVIMRLMDMGIEPFLINAAITGLLAQRLARILCTACKHQVELTTQEKEVLAVYQYPYTHAWASKGCTQCAHLGHKGRMGIFELLVMSDELRMLIVQHPSFEQIRRQALKDHMITLMHDGVAKVAQGLISASELLRVLA